MEHNIGQILAYLEAETTVNELQLSVTEKNFFQSMHQRLHEMNIDNSSCNNWMKIPEHECQTEKSFLEDNNEFFLSLFLNAQKQVNFDQNCLQLSKHLNNCYSCFEVFCQVMRDYYYKSQELAQNL